jgi:hypothetical protein
MTTGYEVALSHSAVHQYRQLLFEADVRHASPAQRQEARSRLHRTRLLLSQIVDPKLLGCDRLVVDINGTFPFTVLYRWEGTTYIYYQRVDNPKTVLVASFCELGIHARADAVLMDMMLQGDTEIFDVLGVPSVPVSVTVQIQ